MTGARTAIRGGRARLGRAALALFLLTGPLPGCAAPEAGAARAHAALDRLLALPLEKLVTALGDASIWRERG